MLQDSFQGIVYIGRNTLRHEDEPSRRDYEDGTEGMIEENPQSLPHVFVKYSGVKMAELLASPSRAPKGSAGIVVQYQKILRDKSSLAEVNAWRDRFTPEYFEEMIDSNQVENVTSEPVEDVAGEILNGEPYVVLDASDVELGVPVQVSDIKRRLREWFSRLDMDLDLSDKSEAEIRSLYDSLGDIV